VSFGAGNVVSVAPNGRSVWALQQKPCPAGASSGCGFVLHVSDDAGAHWGTVSNMPALAPDAATLVRVSASRGWIVSDAHDGPSGVIVETENGGDTWQRRADPCSDWQALAAENTNAWLVCGSQPGAGQQLKSAYRSTDGGAHWAKLAATVPSSGYVGGLAATSAGLWLSLQREVPYTSADGGGRWRPVLSNPPSDDFSGFGAFHFVNDTHGWFTNYGVVYRTTDGGGHWSYASLATAFPGTTATL
jgi:photosystem II stability/assembly factor-like uncharacterized protein